MTEPAAVLQELHGLADPARLPGMAKVGITVDRALGVSIPACRKLARRHRGDHELALGLWATGVHEARIVASMIDDPDRVDRAQLESWVLDLDSWDLCDQVCSNLFDRTTMASEAAARWVERDEEFVKRAGFVLIAARAHREPNSPAADERWVAMLPVIRDGALDERNYVKKAVNWALREIGKRNETLRMAAVAEANQLIALGSRSARWIGRDALRELTSDAVIKRTAATDRREG